MSAVILNKIFNAKAVEQLAWRGHMEYARLMNTNGVTDFENLNPAERDAWISATDRILELALWELEQKLKM